MPTASTEFLDTNILVYEWDASDKRKQEIARKLVRRLTSKGVISSQVAQEFSWVVQKKLGMTPDETCRILKLYGSFRFVSVDTGLVQKAVLTSQSSRISFWDALIVESAAALRCQVLLTEDLNHGQEIAGVRIVNPFLG